MHITGPIPDDLASFRAKVERLARVINAPLDLLPAYDYWVEGNHAEHKYGGYHLVDVEKGQEGKRVTVSTEEDLMYEIFSAVASEMASHHAAQFPSPNKNFRQDYFDRQVELLALLSQDWATKARERKKDILRKYPLKG